MIKCWMCSRPLPEKSKVKLCKHCQTKSITKARNVLMSAIALGTAGFAVIKNKKK